MSVLKYRPEIDGLRAVAVAPVVLFHAQLGFPGGFVGVDVFFVISGYLITSMILKQGEAFSLLTFWERRVRRILPAATLMVLACLIVGWLVLFPLDFERLGRSVVAQSLMLQNVFFWQDLDYFASDRVRPLLHTWSLAVEEQFYFCLPFLLYALRRASRQAIVWVLAALALVSFGASVYGARWHASATFYLLPTRAWELLVGSLVAALPRMRSEKRWVNEGLSAGGLLAILAAASCYRVGTRFPGETALLPCLGAVAVIVGTSATPTLVRGVLSSRPFVWLGIISYSLYLWHWPLFSFAHYGRRSVTSLDSYFLVALAVLAGWASWRFIEQPVRTRSVLATRRPLFGLTAFAMAGFLAGGAVIAHTEGVASRWSSRALSYADGLLDSDFRVELGLESAQRGALTPLGIQDSRQPIELLVWGDSHAMAILHVVDIVCRERGLRCMAATHSDTAPLLDFPATGVFSLREQAEPFGDAIVDFARKQRVKRILLAGAWAAIMSDAPDRLRSSLVRTLSVLRESGARVVILKDVPTPHFDVPLVLARAAAAGGELQELGIELAEHRAFNREVDAIIDSLPEAAALVLDPAPGFCGDRGLCRVEQNGHPLYFDDHHLSTHGALTVRPLFERLLAKPFDGTALCNEQGDVAKDHCEDSIEPSSGHTVYAAQRDAEDAQAAKAAIMAKSAKKLGAGSRRNHKRRRRRPAERQFGSG